MTKNRLFYYCSRQEADDIQQSGKILTRENENGMNGVLFSNISPYSDKIYDFNLEYDIDTYLKLPKNWVENHQVGGKWDFDVVHDCGINRFMLGSMKKSLDISTADFVVVGHKNDTRNERKVWFASNNSYYHYTSSKNLEKIRRCGFIKPNKYHMQFSGIKQPGICLTDADFDADVEYIRRQCFRSGGDVNKLDCFIELPKSSVEHHAQRHGYRVLPYKDKRRSFILTSGMKNLYLEDIDGYRLGRRKDA